MLRLVLVRHGETLWNRERRIQGGSSNTELSENGKEQAEALAQFLKSEEVAAIYSSPLDRALSTARAIARHHAAPVTVANDLRELEVGEFEGVLLANLGSGLDDFLINWREGKGYARLPGGESLLILADRVWKVIQEILDKYNEGTVVVVSHYFVILVTICKALGMPITDLRRIRVSVGATSILDFDNGRACLVRLNDTCYYSRTR